MSPPSESPPSFYRRPLPAEHIAFASPEGRVLFREALAAGEMEGWFALAEQFHTQADPAFCGLGTLVVVLNALEIDPGRVWKGAWRWYGEELLDCCLPLPQVREKGVTLDELACLARCNGATAKVSRPDHASLPALRQQVRAATAAARGPVLVAAYDRKLVGQTGGGHFSPIAGYHAGRDLVLILDVARFKYPPHWIPLPALWQAMGGVDPATGKSRGWVALDRNERRVALPLYFRMSADQGLGALASTLLEDAPALLARAPTSNSEDLLAGWIQSLEAQMADRLCRGLGARAPTAGALPPEHQVAADGLLAELRGTPLFAALTRARAAVPSTSRPSVPNEVLAALLLALPEQVLSGLPSAARSLLNELRQSSLPAGPLADEVAALREQMHHLSQWQGGQSPTAGSP